MTMTSSHKISFSIINILDPNKFNSARGSELFSVPDVEGATLEADSPALEDLAKAGKGTILELLLNLLYTYCQRSIVCGRLTRRNISTSSVLFENTAQ